MISVVLKIILILGNLYIALHYTTFYPLTITVTTIVVLEHNKRQKRKARSNQLLDTKKLVECLLDIDQMVGDGDKGGGNCNDDVGNND